MDFVLCTAVVVVLLWLNVVFYERMQRWRPPWPDVPWPESRVALFKVVSVVCAVLATFAFVIMLLGFTFG